MKFTVKDERTESQITFFLGTSLKTCNTFAKKKLKIDNAFPDNTEDMEGLSYMFQGKAVVWIHHNNIGDSVKLYKILLHEILHCCFHFDSYWEDDEKPIKYDICVKSEANIIGFAEYFFGKTIEKIINHVKKKK
ncbi:MAG: hypothetical protein CMD96_05900 [Gammaproteobacteria bacterium]|nr:hypothetical protein [Gammaproteobacteria bacterium]|tara:strand:+ start:2895 stop:3296 length:402 start_codon:yes stop_codon:yes gene_type:complete